MSPAALKAVFSPDGDSDLIILITIYDPVNTATVSTRIADGYTKRILESADEVVYGVTSGGYDYTFLPIQISLPSEEEAQAPRCSLIISDVTRYLTPIIRELQGPPRVKLELVLNKTPDVVEVSFDYLYISSITYNKDNVTCELTMINLEREPFPVHSFTPSHFPGLF
jgi:hypothetical protein